MTNTFMRDELVDGTGPWHWPEGDDGAWEGPSQEFVDIKDKILKHTRAQNVIFQAGGCCGMYPKLFAKYFKIVYTCEPSPINYSVLHKNCPEDNILKFNCAVGEFEDKQGLIMGHPSNVGTNRIGQAEAVDTIQVDMRPLDSFNLTACDAIQFDLEGYEPQALMGGAKTIQTFLPVISLETRNPADLSHVLLEQWGYRVVETTRFDTIFAPYFVP